MKAPLSWGDRILMLCLFAFALSSFLMDPLAAFHIPLSASSSCPVIRASYAWAQLTDPLWIQDPPFVRIDTFISVFIYGPMYVLMVLAFWRRWNWIRLPAIVISGALATNVITYVGAEFIGDQVAKPLLFVAVNAPYFLVAAALVWRMRGREPFAPASPAAQ
jgi:hypothetical protein